MKFKRGDTFAFSVYLKDENGEPIVVEVENIKCQVRTISGDLIDTLTISTTEIDGEYNFLSSDTSGYTIGILEMDIEVIKDGVIGSTETINIEVLKDVTRDE